MWTHFFQQRTELTCEQLWPILADVARWPESDRNIDYVEIDRAASSGTTFTLKVRNGPRLNFIITEFEQPHRYADVCRMPLARMQTRHTLIPTPDGTTIRVDIEIKGQLASLWGRLVGRKHVTGLPAQTDRLIATARARLNEG